MGLTRHNRRFDELAALVEVEFERLCMPMSADPVDSAVNARIDHVARFVGITPHRAVSYVPDDAAKVMAQALVDVANERVP